MASLLSKNKTSLARLSKFACFMFVLAVLWTAALSLSLYFEADPLAEGQRWPFVLSLKSLFILHSCLWFLGLIAIYLGWRNMAKWLRQRDEAEHELRLVKEELEKIAADKSERLTLRQQQLQMIMDNTRAGVFLKDKYLRFVMVNRRFADLLGFEAEDLLGTDGYGFLAETTARAIEELEQRIIREQRVIEEEQEFFLRDDENGHSYIVSFFPIINQEGQFKGLGGTLLDHTDRHRLELELIRARDAAENTSRAKSAFLASISHEIRTSLNGVIGMADLLLRSGLTPDQASMTATVKSSGDALLLVLNDILDLSKIEARKMRLEAWPFSLRNMVFEAVRSQAPTAYAKKLEIIVNIPPQTPDGFIGDQGRLRQIILNLLSNAIKFTAQGEITVKVETLEEDGQQAMLRFSVIDTGIGIAPEKRELIFEDFAQADSSTARRYGGTGLGLAISYRLAAMMGARLSLVSEVGRGSAFWFDVKLPISADPPTRWPQISSNVFAGLKVLFVDDNAANRRIMLDQFVEWDIAASAAAGAEEALETLENALDEWQPFSLLLSDLQMPGKDGADLIRALAAHEHLSALPVILLSSVTPPEGTLDDLHFAANLMKPVRPEELMRAMVMALGLWERVSSRKGEAAREEAGENLRQSSRSLRVLLVDDMEINRVVARRQLTALGHQVTVVDDGSQALLEVHDQDFDLIFMDIQMPVMDGLQTTARLRALETERGHPRTPIVAMTAHALKGDREKYLTLGLDGYLSKPILIGEMTDLIEELIVAFNLANVSAPNISGGIPGPAPEIQPMPLPATAAVPGLDENLIRQALGPDRRLVQKSMELYMRDAPALLDLIEAALTRGSPVEAATDVHALKGISAYYTAGTLLERIKGLEKAARYSTWPDDQEKLLAMTADLRSSLGELIAQMKRYLSADGHS